MSMDINGREDGLDRRGSNDYQDPSVSLRQDVTDGVLSEKLQQRQGTSYTKSPSASQLSQHNDSTSMKVVHQPSQETVSFNRGIITCHSQIGLITQSNSSSCSRLSALSPTYSEGSTTMIEATTSSESSCRTSPCSFSSARNQSYGHFVMPAGVAGLSTTSATLAFLPLRASGELSKTSVQSTSESAANERTDSTLTTVSSVCSFDLTTNIQPKMSNPGVSGTAAAIWDRRTIFFSEAPKPVSLLAERPPLSFSPDSMPNAEDRLKPDNAGNNLTAGGQSGSTVASYGRLTNRLNALASDDLCRLSLSSESKMSVRSSIIQQPPPPPTPIVQSLTVEPAMLTVEAPTSLSVQRESGLLLSRSKESPEVEFTSSPGTSPKGGNGDGHAALVPWYRSSPRNRFTPNLPVAQADSFLWDTAGESGCQSAPAPLTDSSAGLQHSQQFYDAFMQSLPSNSSPLVTPPKVGNIQKLKAFFGETTPRIIEAKSDARLVSESTETSVEMESSADCKKPIVLDMVVSTKSTGTASALLDRSTMTAKGKKMANWVLTSRHHSSHPQLPSTRPKKSMTDREPSLSPKQKEHRTWKGKVVRTFKRHSSSSAVVTSDPPSQPEEITATFGVPLECCYPSLMNELVPLIVEVCTQVVAERGIDNQGIYRVPGNSVAINILVEELNRDPESACLDNEKWQDVNSVSSLLKLFFRKLPDSLITDDLYEDVIAANRIENSERRMLKLKKLLHELPEHNFETFRFLAMHLNKIASREEHNKMDAHNLAIVFGPTLVRPQDNSMVVMVKDMADQCRVVETIIVHCDWFFSSWDEDVNVPVDGLSGDATPISSMNQQLLAKAESLAAAPFYRDFMSSFARAKSAKKKHRLDKSKSEDLDPDASATSSGLAGRRLVCNSDELSSFTPLQRAVGDHGELTLEIRRYPAYRFELPDCIGSGVTENAKPRVLHRTSHSCESLRIQRERVAHQPACVSRSLLPPGPPSYPYNSSPSGNFN